MKAYSQDLRDRSIDLHENKNYSKGQISKLLKIGCQILSEWIRRYKETGDYSSKQHLVKGRNARFTDKQIILDYINNNGSVADSKMVYILYRAPCFGHNYAASA